jgi:hypothetical protein
MEQGALPMKKLLTAFITTALLIPSYSMAATISFTDPVGDHTGIVDVVGMDLNFDAGGNYTIDLTADAANPFAGDFRININLFNVTLDELFQSAFNDFSLGASQISLSLSGSSAIIPDWLASHSIATSTLAGLGNPSGSSFFRSSVANLPFEPICDSEDIIGIDGCSSTVPAVPVAATFWLFGTALIGFVGMSRRRKVG